MTWFYILAQVQYLQVSYNIFSSVLKQSAFKVSINRCSIVVRLPACLHRRRIALQMIPLQPNQVCRKKYGKEDAFVYTLRLPVLSPTPPSRHSTIRSSHPIFAITWHNHRFFTAILTHQMSSTDQNVIRNYHIRTPSCALFWKHNSLEYLPVTHPLQLTHPTATPPSPLHRPLVYLLTGNGTLFDYKCHCREMTESDQFLRFNLFFKL